MKKYPTSLYAIVFTLLLVGCGADGAQDNISEVSNDDTYSQLPPIDCWAQ